MKYKLRLVSELFSDTYKNSSGSEIAVLKISNDVLMTSKEMAKIFSVGIPAVNKNLKKFLTAVS
jgi:hypothetical protein